MTVDVPLRVVFVCTANICRSAYASVRAAQLFGEGAAVEVSSAGTHGWIDQPTDEPIATELRARGADPFGRGPEAAQLDALLAAILPRLAGASIHSPGFPLA